MEQEANRITGHGGLHYGIIATHKVTLPRLQLAMHFSSSPTGKLAVSLREHIAASTQRDYYLVHLAYTFRHPRIPIKCFVEHSHVPCIDGFVDNGQNLNYITEASASNS